LIVLLTAISYGGTNAHIIIEQAQEYLQAYTLKGQVRSTSVQQLSEKNGTTNGHSTSGSKRRLFTLSAFDKSSGKQQAQALREYLARPDISENTALLEELEYTLNYRRSVFGWKHALHASSREELNVALESEPTYVQSSRSVTVAFCFTGQGAQW
jgi:acyl transferase domain-containing protein